jgi:putative redox protein
MNAQDYGDPQFETVSVDETTPGSFQVKVSTANWNFLADEPIEAGGLASGPSPYGLLSAALGSCSLMTMRLYANRKKWPLEDIHVEITHYRNGLRGNDTFVKEIRLVGILENSQRSRLLEIAAHCPVRTTLSRGSDIRTVLLPDKTQHSATAEPSQHARDMSETCESL